MSGDSPAESGRSHPGGRSLRYLCPHCHAELLAGYNEVRHPKACTQCQRASIVPRPPVGINQATGAMRLPVALPIDVQPPKADEQVSVALPKKEPAAEIPAVRPTPDPVESKALPVSPRQPVQPTEATTGREPVKPPPPEPPPPPVKARRWPWMRFAGGMITGVVLGVAGYLYLPGWEGFPGLAGRGTGGQDIAADRAALEVAVSQWRIAEISAERIEKDYKVTLSLNKSLKGTGIALDDIIASTEKAIAAERAKIGAATDEIVAILVGLVARGGAQADFLNAELSEAERAGHRGAAAILTRLKKILLEAATDPNPEARIRKAVTDEIIPKNS